MHKQINMSFHRLSSSFLLGRTPVRPNQTRIHQIPPQPAPRGPSQPPIHAESSRGSPSPAGPGGAPRVLQRLGRVGGDGLRAGRRGTQSLPGSVSGGFGGVDAWWFRGVEVEDILG